MKTGTFLILIVGALLMISSTIAVHSAPAQCTIKITSPQKLADGIWLRFFLTSQTNKDVLLLPWFTPLEGFMSDLFEITDLNDSKLLYRGPMVKRMAPTAEDFVLLEEGNVLFQSLDLTQAYSFTPGRYHIQFYAPSIAFRTVNDKFEELGVTEYGHFSCRSEKLMFEVL